jgi:hypothetical protein
MQMVKPVSYKATATLTLPFDTQPDVEVAALRSTGIPVDDLGRALTGFLHMRTSKDYRSRIFRWFADDRLPPCAAQNPAPIKEMGQRALSIEARQANEERTSTQSSPDRDA